MSPNTQTEPSHLKAYLERSTRPILVVDGPARRKGGRIDGISHVSPSRPTNPFRYHTEITNTDHTDSSVTPIVYWGPMFHWVIYCTSLALSLFLPPKHRVEPQESIP